MTTTIPTVDISAAVDGGDDLDAVVEEIRAAMSSVGFLHIVGHGIPLELINRGHDAIVDIDRLPEPERQALLRPRNASRGIFEKRAADGRMLQRGFQFIPYDDLADAEAHHAVGGHPDYFTRNVWPQCRPEFRTTWDELSGATRNLGRLLVGLFARALGADPAAFVDAFRHDVTLYSANWYPTQPVGIGPSDVLNGQHADSGALTVLHQRGTYEGLQVLHRDGTWETVALRPETFVINIGELMSRWTNGVWPATVHRVLAGPGRQDCRSSIAMHFLPNIDELITPLASMVGDGEMRYEPITTYDWQHEFMERLLAVYHLTPALT
jgi:isopenicillin N synthase-like dioxygenase